MRLRDVRPLRTRNESLFRNSALLLIATVELAAGGFLFWQVVAHLFSPAQVGRASAVISMSTLVANLALLGMHNSVIRYLPQWPDRAVTVNSGMTLVAAAATLGSLVVLVVVPVLTPQVTMLREPVQAVAFLAFTVCGAVSLFNDNVFVAMRRSGFVLSRNTVIVVLRLVLPFTLVAAGAFGIVAAYCGAVAVALLVYFVVLRRTFGLRTRLSASRHRLRAMWRFSAGNYLATMILMMPTLLMPVLVTQRVDPASAAYYYIASLLAGVLVFVPQATTRSFFAEVTHAPERLGLNLRRVVAATAAVQVPLLLVLLGSGNFLLSLFGRVYTQSYPLLVLLATTCALTSVGFIGSTLLLVTGRLRLLCSLSALSSAVSLGGAYALAPRGLSYVGWSLLTGELILSGAYLLVIARMLRTPRDAVPAKGGTSPAEPGPARTEVLALDHFEARRPVPRAERWTAERCRTETRS